MNISRRKFMKLAGFLTFAALGSPNILLAVEKKRLVSFPEEF